MKVFVESKEQIVETTADSRGRITIGSEYADKEVVVAILGGADE